MPDDLLLPGIFWAINVANDLIMDAGGDLSAQREQDEISFTTLFGDIETVQSYLSGLVGNSVPGSSGPENQALLPSPAPCGGRRGTSGGGRSPRTQEVARRGYRKAGKVRPLGLMPFLSCTSSCNTAPNTHKSRKGK